MAPVGGRLERTEALQLPLEDPGCACSCWCYWRQRLREHTHERLVCAEIRGRMQALGFRKKRGACGDKSFTNLAD